MDVSAASGSLVNWDAFAQSRAELGASFVRILGYFREDGVKSVAQIEEAMRAHNATAMVIPAHTLKDESRQFGADLDRLAGMLAQRPRQPDRRPGAAHPAGIDPDHRRDQNPIPCRGTGSSARAS